MSFGTRRAGLLALLPLLAAPAAADSDETSAQAHLESTVPVLGGDVTFTVRSPLVGAQVILAADVALGPLNPFHPTRPVLCLTSGLTTLASGTVDATGRFRAIVPTPNTQMTLYVQALVIDGSDWHATGCLTLRIGSTTAASFTDGTSGLDQRTELFSAVDVDWADLDKDGCPDAIVANDGVGAEPLVLMGDCTGDLEDEASLRLPAEALRPTSCVEVGDVNGDSWPDLFLGGGTGVSGPLGNLLLLNDGTGSFELFEPLLLGYCTPGGGCVAFGVAGKGYAVDAEFGDVDGDGDHDLVVTNVQDFAHPGERPDPVTLYRNVGGGPLALGTFVEDREFRSLPSNQPHTSNGDASLADVDHDGDLDVFVCAPGIQNLLFVNDGTGRFSDVTAAALPAEVDESFEATFGDFDGDGDLDIFVANNVSSDPTAVHLYENRTTVPDQPLFVDASTGVPASFGQTTSVRLGLDAGDVEGDGDLDLFVTIHELPGPFGPDGETVLLLNQGGLQSGVQGTFAVETTFQPGLFIAADVSLADIDLDGDLDVYLASSGNLFQTLFRDELWLNAF